MNSIIRFSEASSLALHACTALAANAGNPLSVSAIASLFNSSEAHLSKVMQDLGRAGIVTSARGPRGGFTLARQAREISLLEVYEAIEGAYGSGDCISIHPAEGCQGSNCVLGELVGSLNRQIRDYLAGTTVESTARRFSTQRISA